VAHLQTFRTGWENEHLASYLLSKISFIANPITIADDIGVDFLCTLFEPRVIDNRKQLFPLRSFAIQIKSSQSSFTADNRIEYLNQLELPFFVGIVQQSDLSLSVYSGQFLPMMFTEIGLPQRLMLCPIEEEDLPVGAAYTRNRKSCELKLPFLVKLRAEDKLDQLDSKTKILDQRCTRMHANISTKTAQEYIYRLDDSGGVQIQAGPGSAKTFRRNLYLRLAELFYNLEWLLDNAPADFNRAEYELYDEFYKKLTDRILPPPLLHQIVDRLRQKLTAQTIAGCKRI